MKLYLYPMDPGDTCPQARAYDAARGVIRRD
jgi:hypothetical protein